ncbi:uncharacterized protein LOC124483553 [Hypomesus transpacificus]|uniref:uncharacterized protein LOC124483553 n=1 Tax=Hypomesus transpacificus TaxID=137520 RepID=UPI001F0735E4|nr:uncharacterized protein LOC124483553 [Hypomesus transpacificus]
MCTTIMVLTTLAIILRRRFSNRVKPSLMSLGRKRWRTCRGTLRPYRSEASRSARCQLRVHQPDVGPRCREPSQFDGQATECLSGKISPARACEWHKSLPLFILTYSPFKAQESLPPVVKPFQTGSSRSTFRLKDFLWITQVKTDTPDRSARIIS